MAKQAKPLVKPMSPYWQYVNARSMHTMGLSILHRLTGVALSVGSILLVYWLVAAASGPERYAAAQGVFANGFVQILLIGWVFSFCYHFLNGIRHLVWDTGRGFDLAVARKSGYAVLVAAMIAAALICMLFMNSVGGAA